GFAHSIGFRPTLLHHVVMVLVAAAVVASFEAVGSILVIVMLICPAATARLLTDRLLVQIFLSLGVAVAACGIGYAGTAYAPQLFGFEKSLSAAGGISVALGAIVLAAAVLGPRYGILGGGLRRFRLAVDVAREDMLGALYRDEEQQSAATGAGLPLTHVRRVAPTFFHGWIAVRDTIARGLTRRSGDCLVLTEAGRRQAQELVRVHRLWESFLVDAAGFRPDHVHDRAMELEHFTSTDLEARLSRKQDFPAIDPHGKRIPPPGGDHDM
ncbi:MAG: metal ABC transporter permease, partial [Bdellovibrionales bacterium]|nr:metal ABC transporter permease [Bdellovibrionales bacterium]